ncbi:MAG: ribosome assembly factor SBDS [Sulfolobales archaeon]|nr:ribosome assembly factor SBDS [Sulfolobales archaeon]MCX8185837.1 ribosome assembly factor SBDS [Sulfolobales archaeon]MDW7969094.1 ribosome assembly factor SBDS [Sulfolobales archaeon]
MSGKEYVIAKYESKGSRFEVLVKPDQALKFREGDKKVSVDDFLVSDFIYKDVKKGLKSSPDELNRVFGTEDVRVIAAEIVRKGELQLTTDQRRALLDAKKKQIINYVAKSAIDPKTKTPIPPQRIEKAMEEAKVGVDLYKSVEEQATHIIKEISKFIPIKVARALITIKIPAEHSRKVYNDIRRLGDVKNQQWLSDGALIMELEVPAGLQTEVIDKVNSLCRGSAEVSIKVV